VSLNLAHPVHQVLICCYFARPSVYSSLQITNRLVFLVPFELPSWILDLDPAWCVLAFVCLSFLFYIFVSGYVARLS